MKERALAAARKIWREFLAFTPGQKVVTVAAIVGLVVGGFLFASWSGKPSYAPLFSNLAATDASAIVDKLNSEHKPYQLADGGTTIMVPQKDVYAERLTMSAAGLPNSGNTGYSLLDKEGVTTSEFKQRVDYQRALEGELANTIQSIQGVQAAQVHLAIPQQDVFNDDTQKTTAAVLVTMAPGATITTDQVRSIVNLVSSSVPGLDPNQVTVSDSAGHTLSAAGSGINSALGAGTQAEATQAYEQQLQNGVQQQLDKVLGPGHSVVTINAQLDFDSTTETSHTYVHDTNVPPISQSSSSETYSGTGNGTGGTLGAGTPASSAAPTGAGGQYKKTDVTQDNSVGTVDRTTVSAPGSVKQLGVSIVLDKSAASAVDQATVEQLVSSYLTLDPKRGDQIKVATLPFDTSSAQQAAAAALAQKKAAAAAASHNRMMSLIKTGGIILALAIAVVVAVLAGRKRNKPAEPSPADDLDTFLATLNDGSAPADVPREPAMRQPDPAAAEIEAQRAAIAELAADQPDDVARLMRTWLNAKE